MSCIGNSPGDAIPQRFLYHGGIGPQPNSGYLGVPRTCRNGPAGRLYGAPASSEILALLERILLGEILGALCAFAVMV